MLAGKEPPIAAASDRTLAAAALVAPYTPSRSLVLATGASPADSSRSFSRACTRPVTCCPSTASCDTRPNSSALSATDATRRPPKTRPMSRASTITAISRVDTGQSRRFSARGLRNRADPVGLAWLAYWLAVPALATLWFPIAEVLAGYALPVSLGTCRPTWTSGPRRINVGSGNTLMRQGAKYPSINDPVSSAHHPGRDPLQQAVQPEFEPRVASLRRVQR